MGYVSGVPTVLRVGGFRIVIFLPPHVHVRNATGEVVIELATERVSQTIRSIARMRNKDVITAFWIVEEHTAYLLECWRKYHG
jgi:hypothetical protein